MVNDSMLVRKRGPRSQSALEFLTTYSFVFLIIAVVIALLLMFSSIPKSTLPFTCNFYSGFECLDASLTVNSSGSPMLLIEASDTEPGTVNINSFSAFLNFYNSKSGYCVPNVAQAGEVVYCVANLTGSVTLGSVYSGTIKMTANYCAPGPANMTAICVNGHNYTYTGNIRVQATKFVLSNSYYLPVNITNSQSYAAPAHFQQMIQFLPHNYTIAESANMGNIRFYYGGKELYSWCESNCSSSSAGVATFWVRTPQAIPPGQSMQIYMYFLPKSVQYDGVYAGEAPQLSPVYAEYDNGASVFSNYWNFAGTSLPSGLTFSSSLTASVNNGLSVSSSGGTQYAYYSGASYSDALVIEEYLKTTTLGNSGSDSGGVGITSTSISPLSSFALAALQNTGTNSVVGYIWYITNSFVASTTTLNNDVFTVLSFAGSNSSQAVILNYKTLSSNTVGIPSSYYLVVNQLGSGDANFIQWLRTRAYPPNGVMPSVKFGTLTPE